MNWSALDASRSEPRGHSFGQASGIVAGLEDPSIREKTPNGIRRRLSSFAAPRSDRPFHRAWLSLTGDFSAGALLSPIAPESPFASHSNGQTQLA